MKAPELPLDEAARLRALHDLNILDTPADERFDRLTRLAQSIFKTPIALVSLIDSERQWFKSALGLDVAETARDVSFCGHAINDDSIFTIPDAQVDPRFADNPLVTGDPHIRFYAGVPICSPDKHHIGTFCIIDKRPRELTSAEKVVLRDLSKLVEEVIADSQRRVAHSLLAQREGYLHALLATMNDGVLTVSFNGRVLSANPAAASMLGFASPAQLSGLSIRDFMPGVNEWERATEVKLKRSDDRRFPAAVSVNRLPGGDQLVILRDISAQRHAETELSRGLSLLRAISQAQHKFIESANSEAVFEQFLNELLTVTDSPFGLMVKLDEALDEDTPPRLSVLAMNDKRWNERAGLYYQLQLKQAWRHQPLEGLLAKVITDRQPVVGAAPEPLIWGGMMQIATDQPMLALPLTSGGQVLGAFVLAGRERGYDAGWAGFTEPAATIGAQLLNAQQQQLAQRQSEQKVRDTALELQILLDTVPTGILKLDEHGVVLQGNRAAQFLLLMSAEGVAGSNLVDALVAGDRPEFLRQLDLAARAGVSKSSYTEAHLWRHDGSTIPVEYLLTPLPAGHGTELTVVMRDITERKAADRAKSEFISTVSHELRTPLTSIRGSLGLILSGKLGEFAPRARNMLEIANRNSERLTQLINDILDMEKITMGAMSFNVTMVNADSAMEAAVTANEGYGLRHDVRLQIVHRSNNERILADELRLQQVFANLVSNAIKYSPAGQVVELSAVTTESTVRFGVRDHGTGIPEHFRDRIFQRFSQADSSDMRAKGGTGLGLSIARSIVEQLGGRIGFETSGEGTEFYFELPLAQPAKPQQTVDILICEDNADVAEALRGVLAAYGISSQIASTAAQAQSMLVESSYRLLLLDLGLPDREGLDFLRDLRQGNERAQMPVIIISGRENIDPDVMSTLGVHAWMQKPVEPSRLLKVLRSVLGGQAGASVLHVEDDRDYAQVVDAQLGAHMRYQQVSTLQEATAALQANAFDIVLLDLGLPDGDGADLLPHIPAETLVVVLSGRSPDEATRERAAASLSKDAAAGQDEVLATLKRLIGRSEENA